MYHDPVLLKETVDGLAIKENGTYVDVTFGGGGHSKEILSRLGPTGRLYAFDQDEDALANTLDDERFVLINENFKFLKQYLRFHGVKQVDGVLADFGVSSHQFDEADRGFSIRFDGDLDMRMDRRRSISAFEVVNGYDVKELTRVLKEYGELRNAYGISTAIVNARSEGELKTTEQLKGVLGRFLPKAKENRILAQIYQAVRIEVNEEIAVLKAFLTQIPEVLKPGGRLSLISYHSLEDRLVKRFIRDGKFEGEAEKDFYGNVDVPLKKVGGLVVPTAEEIARNNRARSAKLRIAERL
ncbi:16S rRNA (cytosine(1402)-N(4))-methyltransferase [Croceivirga radicis]|uniref:Ribosomal RNA small subunit methyltransferase H n=1 Tax=Croceivirga radicis TaxID=1929488 RepID=A0A1V6LUM9_9FLAO|nr:16S rRNA (cytosine(1402)-N(4))-methyltransferase RsmH [Croceivirga radicis]OQD43881.1 16S rRNA (cytosine(1402)-N(4))-methyltransferase [Croceivirga radicis]